MAIATTLGTATGNTAAYGKHYVISSGINGKGFVAEFARATVEAYTRKDAELLARREEMRAIAASGSARKLERPKAAE